MSDSLRASAKGLQIIEQHRIQRRWDRQDPVWYDLVPTSRATLKRFLEGTPVSRETFVRLCEAVGARWQDIVEQTTLNPLVKAWDGVPDVSVFYGRTAELANLTQWIIGDTSARCRLVALLGMSGIGKTPLVAKLAEQLQTHFECLIWRSLLSTIPVSIFIDELIQFLTDDPELTIPDSLDSKISCLINCLKQRRSLLVLDQFETILSNDGFAGQYQEAHRGYSELLRRVGQESHNSCMVLTSREKTSEIAQLEGIDLPVRSLQLKGLDDEAARKLLRAKGLTEEAQWGVLIQIYRGNPIMLKMVAATIGDSWNGNVSEFLKNSGTIVTGDLKRFIEALFSRLSSLEKQVTIQLASTTEPVSFLPLQQALEQVSATDLHESIESLVRRSFLEKSSAGFTLPPVVREYINEYINRQLGE
jgi:NB-ARC domain